MSDRMDQPRSGLADIAENATSADLHGRALARSRQIGRRRAILVGAGVAAVVGLVATSVLLVSHTSTGTTSPDTHNPTATAEPSPSASPSRSRGVELDNATIELPAFPAVPGVGPCPVGAYQFSDGQSQTTDASVIVLVRDSVLTDLDADGGPEVVGLFDCYGPTEGRSQQAVAFRRTPAGGYAVIGQVVGNVPGVGGDRTGIGDLAPTPGGINVEVFSGIPGSAPPQYAAVRQWRTYRMVGDHFEQSAGSTTFAADPTVANLSATVTHLVFDPPVGNCRTGWMTLAIRNGGPQTAHNVSAAVIVPENTGELCPNLPPEEGYASLLVPIRDMTPGGTTEVVVRVVTNTGAQAPIEPGTIVDQPFNYVELRVGDRKFLTRTRIVIEYR